MRARFVNEVMGFERSDDIKVSLQLGKRARIVTWLDTMGVKNYTINPDWTIDVKGYVYLDYKNLTEFPDYIKFNNVSGGFYCSKNQLTSLKGCPASVSGYFSCWNNQLTSLEGCPTKVGGYFGCYDNPGKFIKEDVLKVCKVNPNNITV